MNPSSDMALLPCPFCEGEPMSNPVESMFHTFRIVCPHCEMCGPERMTASEAIAAWQARAAISTQPQQAGWMPISAAPKDGTCILLFTADGVIEGYFRHNEWSQDVCGASYDMAYAYIQCTPTHWMPLPPVPGQEGGE